MCKYIILLLLLISTSELYSQKIIIDTVTRQEITHWGLQGGMTKIFFNESSVANLGASFEYQYHKHFGGGVNLFAYFAENLEYGASLPVYIHIFDKMRIWGGPGLAYTSSISYSRDFTGFDSDGNPIDVPPEESPTTGNFFLQFGTSWDFVITGNDSKFVILPYLNCDFINIETLYLSFGIRLELQFLTLKPVERRRQKI